jgi:D-aspartate ligase
MDVMNPSAVLVGGLANALSVARALAAADISVTMLGRNLRGTIGRSRAVRRYVPFPEAELQHSWLEWLEREAPQMTGAVLLPCDDDGLELLARNRGRLEEAGYRPWKADDDVVLTMLDKSRTYAVARELGVPVPRTVTLSSEEDVAAAADLGFPCALKPLHALRYAKLLGAKALVAGDRDELQGIAGRLLAEGAEMLATEIIPGPPDLLFSYYSYIDDDGKPLFHATKHKLRQCPVDFGVASYGVTEWNRDVAAAGRRLFLGSGVRGLAEAEFKRDPRDGVFKLIECNHRFTGSNELIRRAGLDLALLAYNRALGRDDPPLDSYRDGVYLWGPILDTHAFLALRRRGELSTGRWLRSLLHVQHFPVFVWRDPVPTLLDLRRRTRLFLGLPDRRQPSAVATALPLPRGSTRAG